jgi:hypothetical protein
VAFEFYAKSIGLRAGCAIGPNVKRRGYPLYPVGPHVPVAS